MRKSLLGWSLVATGIAAVVACGDDGPAILPSNTDGGPVDASSSTGDASADAAPGPSDVTVTVVGPISPKAGVLVVFHDATGAVIGSARTGDDGKARSRGTPSMVSALVARNLVNEIVTWVAPEAGDELTLQDPSDHTLVGLYRAMLPSKPDGGSRYTAFTGTCGASGSESKVEYELHLGCLRAQNSVLATAYADGTNEVVAFSFKKAVAAPSPGNLLEVTTEAWASPSSVSVSVANPPNQAQALTLAQVSGGVAFESGRTKVVPVGTPFPTATGFAEALQGNLFVDGTTTGAWRALAKRVDPGQPLALDFATALPELSSPTIGGTNAQRPVVSWTGATVDATGGIVRLSFNGTRPAEGFRWTFVVPPGSTTVTAPAMPAEAEGFLPAGGTTFEAFSKPEVGFVKTDALAGYPAYRRLPNVLDWLPGQYYVAPLPKNGNAYVTFVGNPTSLE